MEKNTNVARIPTCKKQEGALRRENEFDEHGRQCRWKRPHEGDVLRNEEWMDSTEAVRGVLVPGDRAEIPDGSQAPN